MLAHINPDSYNTGDEWNFPTDAPAYVYIADGVTNCEDDVDNKIFIKLGWSNDPFRRLRELNSTTPMLFETGVCTPCISEQAAKDLEGNIKSTLNRYSVRIPPTSCPDIYNGKTSREWFVFRRDSNRFNEFKLEVEDIMRESPYSWWLVDVARTKAEFRDSYAY